MKMTAPLMNDLDLLGKFTRDQSQDAFTALVRRHLGLVYSAALRQVRSPQLAEEVAQSVFTDLARSAPRLTPDTVLTAWLYEVTRRTAINVARGEARRRLREQIALEMNAMNANADDWMQIEPFLDEAMHALDDADRTAVLLRFFENKSLREVGETLGTTDDTARKRVNRAIERLREFFAKRGVAAGASGLVITISANAVQAAPVGLDLAISSAAVLGGTTLATTASGFGASLIEVMASTKAKTAAVAAAVGIGAGTCVFLQEHAIADARSDNRNLMAQLAPMAGMRAESDRLSAESRLKTEAQKQRDELFRLRGEVADLRNQLAERLAAAAAAAAKANRPVPDPPDASFRYAEAKDVGMRTPMATLQTRWWAAHTGNYEKFTQTWVEAHEASAREKKRGLRLMEIVYTNAVSLRATKQTTEDYAEARVLQQTLSEDGTEIELTVQSRGTAGWQSGTLRLRRVGDEWKFLALMQTNVLTPYIPE
jgi:RNA polymerase sigma factor (sigma-70 family)